MFISIIYILIKGHEMVSNFCLRIGLFIITVAIWGNLDVAFSQAPEIEWDKNFGGDFSDKANSIIQTANGNFVIAGWTRATSWDSDVDNGNDFWIINLDKDGNVEWEKTFGGSQLDEAESVIQTNDGGFAVAGYTASSDGDVGENNGAFDYWVLKLDPNGALEWERNYGGTSDDEARSIIQTPDGGFVVSGYSEFDDGDYGDGNFDFWILKLDNNGIIEWEKNLDGSQMLDRDVSQTADRANSITHTTDGGYIVAGETFDGDYDYWIIKLDQNGSVEWENSFGGSRGEQAYSIIQLSDGTYAVAGFTGSDDGDVSDLNGTAGFSDDFWILKLDINGNLLWEKTFGGSSSESAAALESTYDGGLIVAGHTSSSDGDISVNKGAEDFWILKLDEYGIIEWEKSLGGPDYDRASSILQTEDNGYAVAGWSASKTGDVSGNNGFDDIWIVKLSGNGSSGGGGGDDGNGGGSTTELLYEDFDEGDFPPNGWERVVTNQDYFWFPGATQDWGFDEIDSSDDGSAAIPWIDEDQDEWMISPELDLTTVSEPQLSFYVLHGTTYLSYAVMKLKISTDANHENWTELWQTEDDGGGFEWRKIEIDLSGYTNESTVKLGWQYVGNNGNDMAMDSIYVYGVDETASSGVEDPQIPSEVRVSQNYPNPFNPTTQITYELPEASKVTLKVYDMLGREVKTLVNERKAAGRHQSTFDASSLSSGMYIYRIQAGNYMKTRKMMLIK